MHSEVHGTKGMLMVKLRYQRPRGAVAGKSANYEPRTRVPPVRLSQLHRHKSRLGPGGRSL